METYYGDYVLLPYHAAWNDAPVVILQAKTSTEETLHGQLLRASAWHTLQRSQEWTIMSKSAVETDQIAETIRVALESQHAAAPYFLAMRMVAEVGPDSITADYDPDGGLDAGSTIWWRNASGLHGLCNVAARDGKVLTLSERPEGLDPGSYVAPIILGTLDASISEEELNGACRKWTLRLQGLMGDINGSLREVEDAFAVAVSISGELVEVSPDRDANEPVTLGVVVSGQLLTVVVSRETPEAVNLGVGISALLDQVAFNTTSQDPLTMSVSISGSLV
ncbi:MAG: hypothetical protein JW739_05645 [Opitutales bacterium]|nr:hypothetical protein [Opitutales bacterium]